MRSSAAIFFALVLTIPTAAFALQAAAPRSATLTTPTHDVTITRDAFGVPHVYANDTYALFYGNGYAMAQDRLFQMDVLRHVGRGHAAEVLGPSQLPLDIAARRDLYTEQERTDAWNALPADQRETFQGFADGVNAWIKETRADPTKLSAEFYAIAHPPEDWIPEDSIAIAQYLLAIFGAGSGGSEFENAQLLQHLLDTMTPAEAEKTFNDMFWTQDNDSYSTIPPSEGRWAGEQDAPLPFADIPALQWDAVHAAAGAKPAGDINCGAGSAIDPTTCASYGSMTLDQAGQAAGMQFKWGSNGMIVSPALSMDGHAMLLGGPQMSYYNPMVPYEVALHGAGYDALGMGVGGAPGVIIGRTTHYSWTVTSGDGEQVDTVAEKLVPGNDHQYYVDGVATDMDCRTEIHYGMPTAIDQKPPVLATQEVCRTVDGPVFAINPEAGYAFVRQSAHRGKELESGIMWLTLAQSADLDALQAHMQNFCFTFNFLQTDDSGDIAYNHWGCNPIHATGYDVRLPRVAGAWDWTGIRHGSDLPHVKNPAQGYLVNWNNKPQQGFSSGSAREQWGTLHRVDSIDSAMRAHLAANGGKVSMQDLKDINLQISTHNPFAHGFVPALIGATEHSTDPTELAAVNALRDWRDCGYCWTDDHGGTEILQASSATPVSKYVYPAMAIYEDWRAHVQDDILGDELGAFNQELNFDPPTSSDPHAADAGRNDNKENVVYNALIGKDAHDWCAPRSCEDQFAATFVDTVARLTAQYNTTDVTQWREPIHMIKFTGLSGGPSWRIPMVNRPSFAHWYDWGQTGAAQAGSVLPPGTDQYWMPTDFAQFEANGALPDVHKRDQLDLYVNFEWKPALMTPQNAESSVTLQAAPPLVAFGCQAGEGCWAAANVADVHAGTSVG